MPEIECVADRFVVSGGDCAIDLADGETVKLVVSSAGGHDEQVQWARRCDGLYRIQSSVDPRLVDYGPLGESRRFEAWRSEVAVPSTFASGVRHVERRIEAALAELFDSHAGQPHVLCVFGPPGSGKSTLLQRLARCARLQGFVPLAVDLLDSPLESVVHGRSVFLLDDERSAGSRALADLAVRSHRRHVIVRASIEDARGLPGIGLSRVPVADLIAAVVSPASAPDARVRRAAERADGNPGRFIRLIRGVRTEARRTAVAVTTFVSRAAERAPVYGSAGASAAIPWPAPGEVDALRRRMRDGMQHLDNGRHAPGERDLRQAIGGLSRRAEWADASEGSLALAASLLKRGRSRDAKAVIDAARESCRKAPGDRMLIGAATLSGAALVDLGRIDEAETVLAAALTVAAHADDRRALAPVALVIARCRFWRGQYSDAHDALRLLADRELDDATRVRVDAMRARLAVALDDGPTAVALSAGAVQRAGALGRADLIAEATYASAFAHLAAGDLAAVRQDVAACVAASRTARDPLRQLGAQLLLCEQLRRSQARDQALRAFAPLKRMPPSALPRMLRCRRDMVAEILADESRSAEILSRLIAATGFHALALFVPKGSRVLRLHGSPSTPLDDAIEVLRLCQTAADESATLTLVCEQVQRQVHAAALGFFGIEPGGLARLASRGPRLDAVVAQRAIDAGVSIAPHQADERVESAVAIRYGGSVIGALAMRWVIGSTPDAARVADVAEMAAAAAAPIVAAALAARRRSDAAAPGELLGTSVTMSEMRHAVERAASAPFAVLIEGESGSGKELVARAIHKGGPRRDRPFVTLNCAAIPDDLVESELFGHARGAFTGAVAERVGVFEEAHTGTLLLDEVGELSPRAQAKVLRVIQEGELRRIGENMSRRVDVRIVSATNRDLRAEAASGRFRLDLLYRLDVVRIGLPPLRDRRDDIPTLVEHIWREATARYGSHATLSVAVVTALVRYDWPGNVRELQNVLAALVVRVGRRGIVPVSALPPIFSERPAAESCRLDAARRVFDDHFVRSALVRCGGRRVQAASELGLTRQGLSKLMSRLGIADDAL